MRSSPHHQRRATKANAHLAGRGVHDRRRPQLAGAPPAGALVQRAVNVLVPAVVAGWGRAVGTGGGDGRWGRSGRAQRVGQQQQQLCRRRWPGQAPSTLKRRRPMPPPLTSAGNRRRSVRRCRRSRQTRPAPGSACSAGCWRGGAVAAAPRRRRRARRAPSAATAGAGDAVGGGVGGWGIGGGVGRVGQRRRRLA